MGHVVSKEGIAMDLRNIKDIMEWENTRNVYDIRSFIGLKG